MAGVNFYNNLFEPPNAYARGPYAGHAPAMPSFNRDADRPAHQAPPAIAGDPTFDILEWHPAYQSCQRFFLDHAQHEPATQALCALINIRLPFQYLTNPVVSSTPAQAAPAASASSSSFTFSVPRPGNNASPGRSRTSSNQTTPTFISLVPYIRRLVVTGFDKAAILHGFFGDDYTRGVLPHVDCERRNYLFAAKSGGWRSCKKQYDVGSGMGSDESLPFMKPLDEAKMEELTAAEKAWSGWLAMEDWMVGPRAPDDRDEGARLDGFGGQPHAHDHAHASSSRNGDHELTNGTVESVE
jgi:hypothetical protein